MTDIVRILRVLEYVGPRDVLAKQLEQNAIKGFAKFGPTTIREAFISNYPEILESKYDPSTDSDS